MADPGTRQLARSSAFAGAKCRGRQVPGAALPGKCRHAQLPATDGTKAFAALAGRSRAGKCRLGAILQLGRLWGPCCVHVWATEGVGRGSSHVWGTQNDNCSGPARPAALMPLPTAPAAGSCLCIKGPGQGHEGSWACRLPSLTLRILIHAARSCPCPRASPAHTCVLACLSFQSIHALTGCLSLLRDLRTARIASHAYISPNAGQACSHAPKMQPQSATAAAANQSAPSYTTVLPRTSRQGGVLLPRHVCSRCWTADASNFFPS